MKQVEIAKKTESRINLKRATVAGNTTLKNEDRKRT